MKKAVSFLMCILLILTVLPVSASAEESEIINPMAYNNLGSRLRPSSFLATADEGYMRVFANGDKVGIEYYDDSFNLKSRKSIDRELQYWGGFYKGNDAYYIAEGSANEDENDSAEVIRINKYDFGWNKLGTANITGNMNLFGGDVGYPFHYGCADMTEHDGTLYLVTGHRGYVDPMYNQGHQGFLMVAVDEENMTGEIVDCDLWHSFAQYVENLNDDMYVLEQSEGSRCTKISKYSTQNPASPSKVISVLDYGGSHTSAWAIPCYATVDALALSSDNILALGTSIDQSKYDEGGYNLPYNIYLTVTPMSDFSEEATQLKWLTDYSEDVKEFIGVSMTKINDNRFMIAWQEYSSNGGGYRPADNNDLLSGSTLHYIFIDGSGNKLTEEFTANAPFSDCQPIVKGSQIVFYSSNENMVDFYSINSDTGEFGKKVYRILGDYATWSFEGDTLTISGTGSLYSGSDGSPNWSPIADKVKYIVIKSGITDIPERAFCYFENLEEVYIEDGLKSIGEEAFAFSDSLSKVTIPASVESIGEDIVWSGYYLMFDNSHVYRAKIYGEKDSYAEEYAEKYGISFVAAAKLSYGNIDGDDMVTSADALIILRASVGLENFNSEQRKFADVNGDDRVDSADSLAVLRYSVGFKDKGIKID